MLAGYLALTFAAAFAGAAFYVNFAEHPARLGLDARALLTQWKFADRRGAMMQTTLAAVSAVLGVLAAFFAESWWWVGGAILIGATWPFTWFVIMPTNRALLETPDSDADDTARGLIEQWGRLHVVRTVLGVLSVAAYLLALR